MGVADLEDGRDLVGRARQRQRERRFIRASLDNPVTEMTRLDIGADADRVLR
jgi:hypothetical protein